MINKDFIKISDKKFKNIFKDFDNKGYSNLGKLITNSFNKQLLARTEDLMMGRVRYKNMFFNKETVYF